MYAEIDDVEWVIKKDIESPVIAPASRRTFLKKLGLGFGMFAAPAAAGAGMYRYKEKQFQTLKLWSTILDIKDIADDEDLKALYKELMQPIDQLIGDKVKGIGEIESLTDALEKKKSIPGKSSAYWTDLPNQMTGEATVAYGEKQILIFNFSNGVSAYYPMEGDDLQGANSEKHKSKSIDVFRHLNKVLTSRDSRCVSLEKGLEDKLKISNNGHAGVRPVLIYCLFFPQGNKGDDYSRSDKYKEVYMYRYPQYIKKDKAVYLEPYENYHPYKRPFFQDFIHHDNALRIPTKADGYNVWLSSIYSDYNKKTIDPIRTLMVEVDGGDNPDDGLFLLCVDFKYIRNMYEITS